MCLGTNILSERNAIERFFNLYLRILCTLYYICLTEKIVMVILNIVIFMIGISLNEILV